MIYKISKKVHVTWILDFYNRFYGLNNLLPDEMAKEFSYSDEHIMYLKVIEFPKLKRYDATWISKELISSDDVVYDSDNYSSAFVKVMRSFDKDFVLSNTLSNIWNEMMGRALEDVSNDNGYDAVLKEMKETYERKNSDYGNSFEKTLNEFGLTPGIAQIHHKFERVKQLVKSPDAKVNESMRDSLLDMCNYIAMTVAWMDKEGKENG